eukprot:1857877-Prymnesium_polylepis.1
MHRAASSFASTASSTAGRSAESSSPDPLTWRAAGSRTAGPSLCKACGSGERRPEHWAVSTRGASGRASERSVPGPGPPELAGI